LILKLLTSKIQTFIEEHKLDDLNGLLLKYKTVDDVPISIIVDQIKGRKKAKEKLPTWYNKAQIIFPPSINMEQSSSEQTAHYKAEVITNVLEKERGLNRMLDLTGGFGVDSFFLSKLFNEAYFVEPDKNLIEIAIHNHNQLGSDNFYYLNTSAEEFLTSSTMGFDFIYLDPSRRSKGNQKIFSLNQCEPNVVLLQERIWKITESFLIKTSPLLDIQQGLKELKYVKRVFVISLQNECKELLFLCQRNFDSEPIIEAIDIADRSKSLAFLFSTERNTEVKYSDPLKYLYEPNASILKSGAFKTIASLFNVPKIHPNTHLYTSDIFLKNFPGRIFEIESVVKDDPKILKRFFPNGKANVTTRNYSASVDELRKKTRLTAGGDKFLIAFSGMTRNFLAVATKLNGL
jgi:16S rRNA G966 N2-methylase RsmD